MAYVKGCWAGRDEAAMMELTEHSLLLLWQPSAARFVSRLSSFSMCLLKEIEPVQVKGVEESKP